MFIPNFIFQRKQLHRPHIQNIRKVPLPTVYTPFRKTLLYLAAINNQSTPVTQQFIDIRASETKLLPNVAKGKRNTSERRQC
jgi:hypothetical protein